MFRTLFVTALSLALFAALAGCGGTDSPSRLGGTFSGTLADTDWTLSDTTHCDRYRCNATSNGTAQVDLVSAEFDPYLVVYQVASDGTLTQLSDDNDSGDGLNARLRFAITQGTTYEVRVQSYTAGSGSYSLTFSTNLDSVTQVPYTAPTE